jgi:DNA-binding IclR family transcriptional regulator
MAQDLAQSMECVRLRGYCAASWQAEVVALATPLVVDGYPVYVLNMSVTTPDPIDQVADALVPQLLALAARLRAALAAAA